MEFQQFLAIIPKIKSVIEEKSYSGIDFQLKMTPKERLRLNTSNISNSKEAAVLVLFYPKNGKTHLLLTLRAKYNGAHSAQISFPGGKKDNSDANLIHTALRETEEEIGMPQNKVERLTPLSKVYIPPSNFWVSPFIGISNKQPEFNPNYEVEKLIEIKLSDLMDTRSVQSKKITTSYAKNWMVPCFILDGHTVWGATAMILSELRELVKLAKD